MSLHPPAAAAAATDAFAATRARKKDYIRRGTSLRNDRRSFWDPLFMDLADNILPRRGRFFMNEQNRADLGAAKKRKLINSKPTVSARTLRAMMMNGIASPSRRWFVGTVNDEVILEQQEVKDWCFAVESKMRETLKKSNIYQCLDNVFGDLGTFGTTALYVEDDVESDVRGYVFPVGSYSLANSARLAVDTCFREVAMTVRQLVEQFGIDACSNRVQDAYRDRTRHEEWVQVTHLIQPNAEYEPGKIGPKGMKFSSCWFETAAGEADDKFLREGGYQENPLMTPRWNVTGEDVYGTDCPGMEALGDAKVLQLTERREEQAFDKVVNPPMAGVGLIGMRSSTLAGDVTHLDGAGGKFEPAMKVEATALSAFREKIARLEAAIEQAYFADLVLMFQRIEAGKMTATEVTARQQEQMQLLGSVMERLEEELLRPLLYRVFMILWRNGKLPRPPEALRGIELKFDFVSVMSQAQKLLSTANIERLLSLIGNLAAIFPNVKDKLNEDQAVDEYADALAVQPSIIRSDDEVAAIRQQRAQAQAARMQAQQMAAAAQGAKVLSEADTSGDNALTRLMGNVTGSPAPGSPAIH